MSSNDSYVVRMTVRSVVGTFTGYPHRTRHSMEVACVVRDKLQDRLHRTEFIVIFSDLSDSATEIYIPADILKRSITEFDIIDASRIW